jgi:hypothetical protein
MHGRGENVYKVLVGNPEGERPDGGVGWRVGSVMGPWGIFWIGVEWVHLALDRDWWQAFVNVVMNVWVLSPQC